MTTLNQIEYETCLSLLSDLDLVLVEQGLLGVQGAGRRLQAPQLLLTRRQRGLQLLQRRLRTPRCLNRCISFAMSPPTRTHQVQDRSTSNDFNSPPAMISVYFTTHMRFGSSQRVALRVLRKLHAARNIAFQLQVHINHQFIALQEFMGSGPHIHCGLPLSSRCVLLLQVGGCSAQHRHQGAQLRVARALRCDVPLVALAFQRHCDLLLPLRGKLLIHRL